MGINFSSDSGTLKLYWPHIVDQGGLAFSVSTWTQQMGLEKVIGSLHSRSTNVLGWV